MCTCACACWCTSSELALADPIVHVGAKVRVCRARLCFCARARTRSRAGVVCDVRSETSVGYLRCSPGCGLSLRGRRGNATCCGWVRGYPHSCPGGRGGAGGRQLGRGEACFTKHSSCGIGLAFHSICRAFAVRFLSARFSRCHLELSPTSARHLIPDFPMIIDGGATGRV